MTHSFSISDANIAKLRIDGRRNRLNGKRYIQVKALEKSKAVITSRWYDYSDFVSSTAAKRALANENIVLAKDSYVQLSDEVAEYDGFQTTVVCEQPGWNGTFFAFADGNLIGSKDDVKPIAIFKADKTLLGVNGDHNTWKTEVADLLSSHHLAEVAMMLGFCAALLPFDSRDMNFGIEFAGERATGKSTLLDCVASIAGPPNRYVVSMNATTNALDAMMPRYRHMPFLLDEANLVTLASGSKGGRDIASLIFQLSEGRSKKRLGQEEKAAGQFTFLMSTNRPWHENARQLDSEIARAVADRMMTIKVRRKEKGGVFNRKVTWDSTVADFCQRLSQAIARNHGTALPHFVSFLTEQEAKHGPGWTDAQVREKAAQFKKDIRRWPNIVVEDRVLHSFAMIYAAGEIAIASGALPNSFTPNKSVRMALRRTLSAREQIIEPIDLLRALVDDEDVLDLRNSLTSASKKDIDLASGIIKENYGMDEFLLTREQIARLPIDRTALLNDPEVRKVMFYEGGRNTVKRKLTGHDDRNRYVCINLRRLLG
ncbi:DUF927 domain-containing protein [Altererythrobacter aurantiacus]|uniref:DUF927 domain-containing protein n=1 Tax=Parapontixanthobacter aurantiacus TaxID=1463599 RepID=A0A844ZF19_9SPHN|nr:DUF927 domain-containing protein [Parapontixanthobacter aurantiacus]MXO86475.1 DUF927 domain-containing protein [Parapontixanthobacter aurantiacus]